MFIEQRITYNDDDFFNNSNENQFNVRDKLINPYNYGNYGCKSWIWGLIQNVIDFFSPWKVRTLIRNTNATNKTVGISGEAYIYEHLLNSGKFRSVKWNMLDFTGPGEYFIFNGNIYFIALNSEKHYDILVETFNNRKIYIEVKSTRGEFGNKIPFYISYKQLEMMELVQPPDEYLLAVVFNVLENPKHFFMTLKK